MPILLDGSTCNDPQNINRYIEDYTCSNTNATAKALRDVRMSFPSGHTSFAIMTAFFCVVRIHEYSQVIKTVKN